MSIAQPGGIAPAASTRRAAAPLATGGFLLLAGALFAVPFLLSSKAQEFDDFFANLFAAPLFALVGGLIYLFALRRFGLSILQFLALIVINLVVLSSSVWLPGVLHAQIAPTTAVILAVDAALLFIIGALVAGTRGQLGVWTQGLILSLAAGVVLAVIYYFFGGQVVVFYTPRPSVPPFLNLVTFFATIVLAVAVYFIGRRWGRTQ
jgi:hypothetical protein